MCILWFGPVSFMETFQFFLNLVRERRYGWNNWKDSYFPIDANLLFYGKEL